MGGGYLRSKASFHHTLPVSGPENGNNSCLHGNTKRPKFPTSLSGGFFEEKIPLVLTSWDSSETRLPASQSQPTVSYTDAHALASQDLTPRNVYPPRSSRGSGDSYGFPSHSSTSSISSAGNYQYYSASVASVDSSVTDYSSTTSESYEGLPSRTLPRPSGLMPGGAPPGPQSMMGQFSSKMPSNTQKKHKCKVCDKRFTRPSSLQTHMYSHTGEKRKLNNLPTFSLSPPPPQFPFIASRLWC